MNEETTKNQQKSSWKRLFLNHHWLVRNIPFFLFLSVLTVLYIYNGHYAEKTIKDINKTARGLNEDQYEYKTVKSEWMFINKQSEVVKAVEPMGLKEILEPPIVLKDSTTN
jgi:predicted membrane protein